MRNILLLSGTLLIAAVLGCDGTSRNQPAESGPAGGAITIWTDSTELFMEYPALIVGQPERFAVHLTDLTDFAPLRSGRIVLRFVPQDGGPPVVATQDAPRSPGIFGPAPEFERAGVYDLTLTVESPQATDEIRVPDLRVYATVEEVPRDEAAADGGISFLKEQQWKTAGFATAFAATGTVIESFEATGQLVPAAGRLARVSAPIAGIIEASGLIRSPAPGQSVTRGQTIAVLTPALGEAGSALALARAELRQAEDEHARAKRLVEAEAVPVRRLHEAEIRLDAAREALAAFGSGTAAQTDGRLPIRSPITGVVATRSVTPGSRVDAGAELFTVVDASVIWLEVNVPAGEAARVGRRASASFRVPGSDLHYPARPVSVGSVIDSLTRTVPVLYAVDNRDGRLKIGMTARVSVGTGERLQGVVIPESAVLEEDGRPVAYVQPEGERFEKRDLVISGRDGKQVLVASGVSAGERVVTGAAYQVRLASLSSGVPAHGHEH